MKKRVAIIGVGITPFKARYMNRTYFELAYDATKLALNDANENGASISHKDLETTVYGIYNELFERQFMPDIFINSYIGMNNKPGTRIASGGATGGYTVRMAYSEVASGLSDLCLCLGVEKCNDCYDEKTGTTTPEVLNAIAYSADMTYEYPMGMMAASSYVSMVNAHSEEFGNPTEKQMAMVSVKNHGNAMKNPKAQSPMEISVDDVLYSRIICYPFKMLDCCLYSEASAALILASEEKVKELGIEQPIWITGVGAANTDCFIGNREDLGRLYSNINAAKSAYKMAGLDYDNIKEQIDVAELHDAFSGQEVISYEELGFVKFGEGGPWIEQGYKNSGEGPWFEGELPCNPSGGLIGCGHAVGATGIMSTGEAALQLRENAGEHQVPIEKGRAISHSIGGPGAAYAAVIVMENEEGISNK
ncbi:MAG: thiolase family protein [Promethearchaeota archaeon]|nr:MAG: thiolase family protein [Candidatus Lokiarchaeota archaeon]